jgi:HD-GYP domain-containing protein (c-di-GMP phosphodiesterase class II)
VADAILQKPGKLTPEEFDQIKRHPDLGCFILQGLSQLNYVLPGVRHHHEAFDGTGYPAGLAADKIPLVARILAVADSFDAMSSHRPYRQGMAAERVEEILRSGAGKQWDPEVIDAFFRIVPQIRTLYQSSPPSTDLLASPWTIPTTSFSPNTYLVEPAVAGTN